MSKEIIEKIYNNPYISEIQRSRYGKALTIINANFKDVDNRAYINLGISKSDYTKTLHIANIFYNIERNQENRLLNNFLTTIYKENTFDFLDKYDIPIGY